MENRQFSFKEKAYKFLYKGKKLVNKSHYIEVRRKNKKEAEKKPSRTEIINFLLSLKKEDTTYLEIGVRNPADNFDLIDANTKYSVDPGIEFKKNPVDFKLTSDEFFQKLSQNEILSNNLKFDVIFIDGLHYAEQVDRDIQNSIKFIKNDGFIVLHDCNPPTEWHAREFGDFKYTPAEGFWNGTTWKAFLKWRFDSSVNSCCIDSDWGIGIVSLEQQIGKSITPANQFFEYYLLDENRKEYLNLMDYKTFRKKFKK